MKDTELRACYRELMADQAKGDRGACVVPEDLLRLAERRGAERDRIRLFNHVMACEACRREYEMLVAAVEMRPTGRKLAPISLAAAAAAALIIGAGLFWPSAGSSPEGDVLRGPAAAPILVLPPSGRAPSSDVTFVWHAIEGAEEYRFELLDPSGSPVFATATGDTVVALPGSIALVPNRVYSWWVRAALDDGSTRASLMRPLQMP